MELNAVARLSAADISSDVPKLLRRYALEIRRKAGFEDSWLRKEKDFYHLFTRLPIIKKIGGSLTLSISGDRGRWEITQNPTKETGPNSVKLLPQVKIKSGRFESFDADSLDKVMRIYLKTLMTFK